MAELGTIETGEWSPDELNKWEGTKSPLISVRCKFGRIMASIGGDAGEYDDLCVDLVADDGRVLQLAVVSCDEELELLSVYAYDGMDECPAESTKVAVSDDSCWY